MTIEESKALFAKMRTDGIAKLQAQRDAFLAEVERLRVENAKLIGK